MIKYEYLSILYDVHLTTDVNEDPDIQDHSHEYLYTIP